MSNFDLDDMLSYIPQYRGTFAMDQLPKTIKRSECGIVNTLPITKNDKVGHWVCYYNDPKKKYCEFYDSFGLVPHEILEKYLKTSKKPIRYNTTQIQNISSVLCGYYCHNYITGRSAGVEPYDLLYNYHLTDTDKNEQKIKSFAEGLNST